MKAGEAVKLVGIPPNLSDAEDMLTRSLFEKCLGKPFVIEAMESVEGMPFPLAKLDVGHVINEESWKHSIWVEPEYLQALDAYRVLVVLDREYGERLSELAANDPVWIVDTPTNRAVAQRIWSANPNILKNCGRLFSRLRTLGTSSITARVRVRTSFELLMPKLELRSAQILLP
jgi:hypothetical protein